ncbi:site-specific integrase [Bacillus sp. FJAT-49736]|uniref:site-specific integrase n=1 Tax=Bacillus sp. FJAT-49736 TaxID=2833582 RepID=UPI001BC96C15|nr:site-specific integrase [Bacillus sp. FJAT-49736]MBS4173518.1 tyrosine-type recombinase/integrase [Bacillus sp. FJAT-49736]
MRGYVRKRGNKWSYTVDIGKDPITGKRKQKTKSGFKTEKEAESALTEIIYEINKGIWIAPQEIRVKDFAEDWMKMHRHKLRATTAEQYQQKIKSWIIPLLGNYKIQDLKPIHAQKYSAQLLENMKENTASKVYSITKMIINHAVDLEIINKNPFKNISLIREKKTKITTWTFDDLEHFLKVTKRYSDVYYRLFATAAYTGLRKGELLALTKDDVNFEKKFININKSLSATKEEGVKIGDLKTPSSRRKVAIDTVVASILKEQIAKNNAMKLKLGKEYHDSNLIFCHPDGRYFYPTGICRVMDKYIELSGLNKIRFHDLRHTHATLLLELGVNPKVVADRLGHASVKITLDTYSHVSLDLQSDVAETFSKHLKKA